MKTVSKLTLDDARVVMAAAEDKSREIGVDMDIAITDDSGNLLMFHRMDNARITSIEVAISKAFTAAAARRSTRSYGEVSGPGGPAFGIHVSHQGRFMALVHSCFALPREGPFSTRPAYGRRHTIGR